MACEWSSSLPVPDLAPLRPQAYRNVKCTGRSRQDQHVLNDLWVLFPTSIHSENFQPAQKNPNEQAMFKCEDERYELDMGMPRVAFSHFAYVRLVFLRNRAGACCDRRKKCLVKCGVCVYLSVGSADLVLTFQFENLL